ncbi:MAG TPA: glutathione S-transferase family protein [Polyangiaceae bacterium]|jgi:glutathione S-transferase|nr:glutathione S-transferase family protein [Polyangiaceae bacterium]
MTQLFYFETVNPRKACAVAKYLKSPIEYVRLDPKKGEHKTPEHLARHPYGRVPVLVSGKDTVWESAAIMTWLAEQAKSELWPTDPRKQVDVVRWLTWDAFHFLPHAGAFYFERHIKKIFGLGPADEAVLAAKAAPFHQSAKVLDAELASKKYLTGDALTIADFCVAAILPQAEEIHLPIADYANIRRWHDGLMELDAWRDPWPVPAQM